MNSWRDIAKPIIANILKQFPYEGNEQKMALFNAYPFGERKYHPYKVWLDEIKKQKSKSKITLDNNYEICEGQLLLESSGE